MATADRAHVCPGCGDDRLTEWDETLRVFTCSVCSTTWRRPYPPLHLATECALKPVGKVIKNPTPGKLRRVAQ